jgi:Uncharacterized protein conserved in bacteria
MGSIAVAALLVLSVLVAAAYFVWWVFARLYFVRATADRAFVRTGGGKPKVVIGGGAFVLSLVAQHHLGFVGVHETAGRQSQP